MTQVRIKVSSGIQQKMIDILRGDNVRGEVLFFFMKTNLGVEPGFVISEETKDMEAFQKELYALCDKYFDFKKIYEETKT